MLWFDEKNICNLAVLYLLKYIKDNLLMCKSNATAGDDAQNLNKKISVWG